MIVDDGRDCWAIEPREALRELNAARLALDAALAANRTSRESGRPGPCDDAAIISLTLDVVRAVTLANRLGIRPEMSGDATFGATC